MSWAAFLSIIALVASFLSVGVSIVTLRFARTPPELSALEHKCNQLDLDLTDLADRTNTWMRRDAARTARAGQGSSVLPATPSDIKADLRRRAALLRGVPQ